MRALPPPQLFLGEFLPMSRVHDTLHQESKESVITWQAGLRVLALQTSKFCRTSLSEPLAADPGADRLPRQGDRCGRAQNFGKRRHETTRSTCMTMQEAFCYLEVAPCIGAFEPALLRPMVQAHCLRNITEPSRRARAIQAGGNRLQLFQGSRVCIGDAGWQARAYMHQHQPACLLMSDSDSRFGCSCRSC